MEEIVQFVDQSYCINLDSRPDRWREVSLRFKEIGIDKSVKRVSAVTHDDPREGCRQSHIRIVEEAIERGYENILIFEDDVLFIEENRPDFIELKAFLRQNEKWELFYFGGSPVFPARKRKGCIFRCRFYHTHAYIINERGYDKVLRSGLPIDVWFSLNTVSYGFYPLYAVQGPSRSDIQNKDLHHLKDSMLNRYEKLVEANTLKRWLNYISLHYLNSK